ncbi:geranylgeranyl diphosphate synthase type I [Nocardia tenerifensis]|uniref:Geranylgeranyl diphosphate synthase type I n=1 Tax=Nocardia tenerifensis TaxID=228006 RepID=A0A318KKL2_9NOCA|nr:polyprenyl synthetase family protein [Nocardia tenerifensis]PXX62163.1 geranylgeranyl diphosphate synthase type I [Nocardia tenerifensis]
MTDGFDPGAFKARVDITLGQFVARESGRLLTIDPHLRPVAEQLVLATTHGKRLRAAFCYWGWRAAGQPDSDALVKAAAAMELVHAAASVHDDIIDDSPLRHGLPTAHVALRSALHGRPNRTKSAKALAMLVGDLLIGLAGQLFAESGLPAAFLSRARPLWAVLARELIAGECLEVIRTGTAPDTAESLQVIRYKSAKYTVEQPLLIGGALAGANDRLLKVFSAYGLPLGGAFQLRDDLLGLFGDPATTGKANLDDLRARRPTALLAETWRRADAGQRKQLRKLISHREPGPEELHEMRELMHRLESPGHIEKMIVELVDEATAALAGANMPANATRALTELAHAATARNH